MKVLLLGPPRQQLFKFIEGMGDTVIQYSEKISLEMDILKDSDFLVSYGYRYIIKPEVLQRFRRRAINLHISYLPWNRGADPNLWSFLDDTPKGVTIHLLDDGLDTGAIVAQQELKFPDDATMKSSYDMLSSTIEILFTDKWEGIRNQEFAEFPQSGTGSRHNLSDRRKVLHLLHSGWDTPVADLIGKTIKMTI